MLISFLDFFHRLPDGLKDGLKVFGHVFLASPGFPKLQSKAVASKVLTNWLAVRSVEFAQRPGATEADRMMSTCVYSYFKMIQVMDNSRYIMTEQQAVAFHASAMKHLQAYVWLHSHGMRVMLRTPGRRCWLLMPKHHHLWHCAWDTLATRINPKNSLLLSAESFVGDMGRVARACHRTSVSKRTLDRWRAKMALKLGSLAKELRA